MLNSEHIKIYEKQSNAPKPALNSEYLCNEAEADFAQTWWTESGNIGNMGNVEELKKLVRETKVPEVETWQPQLKYQTWEE